MFPESFSNYDDEFDYGIVVLSYEGIRVGVYHDLAKEFSKFAISLDLTENELTDLSFLKSFNKLESLVLDKNRQMDPNTIPQMKSLEILWLNGCNISDISKWVEVIRVRCPKLKCLSMINNPGARSLVNLCTSKENEEYRSFITSRLKNLNYLDEAEVVKSSGLARNSSVQFLSKLFHFHNHNENHNNGKEEHNGCCTTDNNNKVLVGNKWWPTFKI